MRALPVGTVLLILATSGLWSQEGNLGGIAEELPFTPARVETKKLTVVPLVFASFPDAYLRTWISAEEGFTRVTARTVYNSRTEEFAFRLGYGYRFGAVRAEISVNDRVEFQKRFRGRKFVGRERMGGLSFDTRLPLGLQGGVQLEGGEFQEVEEQIPRHIQRSQVYRQVWSLGAGTGSRSLRVRFLQALRFLEGDFQYEILEAEFRYRIPKDRRWFLSAEAFAGGPLRKGSTYPLFEHYFLGGAETLKGWRLYELEGNSAVRGALEARLPLAGGGERERRRAKAGGFRFLWTAAWQAAASGGREVLETGSVYRFAASTGPRFEIRLGGKTSMYLQVEFAHPVHDDRKGQFYFSGGLA